ncbi:MAG: rhodanese-like domain-containing protein [Dehalococcoidales bacterium]|nr:MAG: rhodanese-like domain-containing protein [Dehalococcoidales bacterium]
MSVVVKGVAYRWRRLCLCGLALAALLVVGTLLMVGCKAPSQTVGDITVQEAFDLIEQEQDNPDFVIIDVRTPSEYADGHLENAVNIDFRADDFEAIISELDKDKTYVIYCRTGVRSAGARDVMEELGFNEVYNVLEGIIGWVDAGFLVVE